MWPEVRITSNKRRLRKVLWARATARCFDLLRQQPRDLCRLLRRHQILVVKHREPPGAVSLGRDDADQAVALWPGLAVRIARAGHLPADIDGGDVVADEADAPLGQRQRAVAEHALEYGRVRGSDRRPAQHVEPE